jgi:2-polyprenyl-6-methoxyphenol hydroxylase-like FAD-dependent oxidoreductase
MYDAIIVGARVGGAATGLLLARAGLKVLIVDQAHFPSDTLSTHQLQVPGGARLARWGILDRLLAAGTPAAHRCWFETADGTRVQGRFPEVDGVSAVHSPRRTLLDNALLEAAAAAGAEVRQATISESLISDRGRVCGVRLHTKRQATHPEMARIIVGADGKHSMVARAVGAGISRQSPAKTLAVYTYWSDLDLRHGWISNGIGAWPTNDGMVMSYLARPLTELEPYRADPDGYTAAVLRSTGELGELILSGRRAEHWRATTDTPHVIRGASGPGWVLVGDAGLVMDPITGQGMGNALRDAELASEAILVGLGGSRPLDESLADYVARRDRDTKPMFDFTAGLAQLTPPTPAENALFAAIAADPGESDLFFSVLTGVAPVSRLFSPRHLLRLVGPAGMVRLARSRPRPSSRDVPRRSRRIRPRSHRSARSFRTWAPPD